MDGTITLENFKQALRVWNESTTTSPSGRHLGHYKCILTILDNETDDLAEEIMLLHHRMLQVAQLRKKPYERWKTEVEVMLEKDKGEPKIHRLRIICLYKADYNLFLKIMWAHRLIKHAEKHQLLGDEQGGGLPNRTSDDITMRKMLMYNYSRIT